MTETITTLRGDENFAYIGDVFEHGMCELFEAREQER